MPQKMEDPRGDYHTRMQQDSPKESCEKNSPTCCGAVEQQTRGLSKQMKEWSPTYKPTLIASRGRWTTLLRKIRDSSMKAKFLQPRSLIKTEKLRPWMTGWRKSWMRSLPWSGKAHLHQRMFGTWSNFKLNLMNSGRRSGNIPLVSTSSRLNCKMLSWRGPNKVALNLINWSLNWSLLLLKKIQPKIKCPSRSTPCVSCTAMPWKICVIGMEE